MPIQATGLADLLTMTQRDLGKPKMTEIARDLPRYTARQLIEKNRVQLSSGSGVQWTVMVGRSNSASHVGLGAVDSVSIVDTTTQATADWRNTVVSYAIEAREIDMNREPARINDLVKERRAAAMIDFMELLEETLWGPPVASTDSLTPWGINTWLAKNASEGFHGGMPSGYTTLGLSTTTYPRWKNWTAQYTAITKDDLVRKVRNACTKTYFEPPVEDMPPSFSTGYDKKLYSNYALIQGVEEVAESQNDSLGSDIASMDGKVVIRRMPIMWVPKLDADTTNPLYGVDWGDAKVRVLTGWWMKETNIPVYPGQHTMAATFMDSTWQLVFTNRRSNFVIATGTTYPS